MVLLVKLYNRKLMRAGIIVYVALLATREFEISVC